MKTTKRWKRVDWGYVITHLMDLSMWQNSMITQLSMHAAITPLIHDPPRHKSKRRVPQPQLISTYNKGMGSVDLLDFLSASYRPSISGNSGIGHYLLMY